MNLIQRATLAWKVATQGEGMLQKYQSGDAASRRLFQSLFRFIGTGMPIWSEYNKENYITKGYNYNSMVYSIVSRISRKASMVDYHVYEITKGGKKEKIDEHEALQLIYNPNEYQGKSEFMEQYHGFKLITGDSFIYAPRLESGVNQGKATEMHIMPSQLTEIVSGGEFQPVRGYKIIYDQISREFEAKDVMHSKYANYNYNNGAELYGLSPIQAGFRDVEKSNSNTEASKKSFDNMGAAGVLYEKVMQDGQGLNDTQLKSLQANLDKKVRGTANKSRILITAGDLGYINFGVSPVDLNLLEDKKATLRDVCNIYSFPSGMMNDPEYAKNNNRKEERKAMWTDAIMPGCYSFAEEFTRWMLPAYGKNLVLLPDTTNIAEMQPDKKEQVDWLYQAWWLKASRKQEIMGEEPDKEMDKYFIPANLLELGEEDLSPNILEEAKRLQADYFKE